MNLLTGNGEVKKYPPLINESDTCETTVSQQKNKIIVIFLIAFTFLTLSAIILCFPQLTTDRLTLFSLTKSVTRTVIYSEVQQQNGYIKFDGAKSQEVSSDPDDKVVSCYYDTPNQQDTNQLMPTDIHPHLCTHINIAFARVVNKTIFLDDQQYKVLSQVVKLKQINPKLKIMLSVGGAGNDNGFSQMVVDHASRKIFIKSIKSILRNYTLDGIDLDWEFPAIHHEHMYELKKRERQHFSQLLQEIRREYIREKRDYLLTVAVAAPETLVDVCYDIDQLNTYTDFVNIMTYDFHYFTKFTPFTGLNSPLFARATEQLYMATLNINYTVNMYINKGLDRNKIVVGIPTYGHTFTLINPHNTRVGSPASSYGSLGSVGFVNYPDVCTFINRQSGVTVVEDKDAKVPYLFKNKEWVSYDTPKSVMEKAKYIKDNNLRGAMIYSLNADDYGGLCGGEGDSLKFPLSRSVKNILLANG